MSRGPTVPEIDPLLHEPARLRLLVLLAMVEEADFMYLLQVTGLSRGNQWVQLQKLEEEGIIGSEQRLVDGRARTTYHISEKGRRMLGAYKKRMLGLLDALPD